MATDKTFTVAGVSTSTDGTKVRFANDVMRVKVLAKNGHTDILLIELPNEMLKLDAVNFIKDLPEFQTDGAQEAIGDYLAKYTPKAPKAKVERKPAKAKDPAVKEAKTTAKKTAKAVDTAAVDAALDELEDAPF